MTPPPSDPSDDAALTLSTAFGSQKRTGTWVVPGRIVVHQRFGSTSLDFREATVASPVVTLELDVIENAPPPPPGGPVLDTDGRIIYGSLNIRRPR